MQITVARSVYVVQLEGSVGAHVTTILSLSNRHSFLHVDMKSLQMEFVHDTSSLRNLSWILVFMNSLSCK